MKDLNSVLENLRKHGFKITPQRLAVIEFLVGNTEHPTAEMIYAAVKKAYPMISLSTIYNTLDALLSLGEIQDLAFSSESTHFDPSTRPHHHFQCLKCRQIKDIFRDVKIPPDWVDGHRIESWRVYFYGICSDCLNKQPEEVLS